MEVGENKGRLHLYFAFHTQLSQIPAARIDANNAQSGAVRKHTQTRTQLSVNFVVSTVQPAKLSQSISLAIHLHNNLAVRRAVRGDSGSCRRCAAR